MLDVVHLEHEMIILCSKCGKEIEEKILPISDDKPLLSLYYDEETFKIICKECYEKAYYNANK